MAIFKHTNGKAQFFDQNGNVLAGGMLYTYEVGTTTDKATYTDFALTSANTNPVILDARGECDLWVDGGIKFKLNDADDVNIWTVDIQQDVDATDKGALNLTQNGSFEDDSNGDGIPNNWTVALYTNGTQTLDTAAPSHGTQSIKFTGAGSGGGSAISDLFLVSPTSSYAVSFTLKSSLTTLLNIVEVWWYTAADVFISKSTPHSSATPPTSFTDYIYIVTPPATAFKAAVKIYGVHDTGGVLTGSTWFDNINFNDLTLTDNILPTNLLDKSATETITGQWSFNNGLTQFGSTAPGDSWPSIWEVLEINTTGAVSTTTSAMYITENAYYDTNNSRWEYKTADLASMLQLDAGLVSVLTAPTGAADAVIPWITALRAESNGTVKMLGGNCLISPDGVDFAPIAQLVVYDGAGGSAYTQYANSTTGATGSDGFFVGIDGNEKANLQNTENTDMTFFTNNVQELYLDATNGGVVAGNASGEGKGEGTFHGPNGVYSKNIELYPPTDVTGYYEAQNVTIHDDIGNPTTFTVDGVIGAAWESVGPTGSGATNIWTALDDVPSTAKGVILKSHAFARGYGVNTGYNVVTGISARRTGSTAAAGGDDTDIGEALATGYTTSTSIDFPVSARHLSEHLVPIDGSLRFDLYLNTANNSVAGGTTFTNTAEIVLVGWVE
jgi:hypothetical protein